MLSCCHGCGGERDHYLDRCPHCGVYAVDVQVRRACVEKPPNRYRAPKKIRETCPAKDCTGPVTDRGMCIRHYNAWRDDRQSPLGVEARAVKGPWKLKETA